MALHWTCPSARAWPTYLGGSREQVAKGSNFVPRGAAAYDGYMGRWSRRLAPLFLAFAGCEPGERILDVGCGTGNLTAALAARGDLASIDAVDFDADFVAAARERHASSTVRVMQGDACALDFSDSTFDRALSMLVLHFVADAAGATHEMRRVLRPGGVAAACVWDIYGGMPSERIFWDTVSAIEPAGADRWAKTAFRPMTGPGQLRETFESSGFTDVSETMLAIRMEFSDFEDYWAPIVRGQGNREAFLAEHGEERLKTAVRAAFLSGRPDGYRSFASVAWAVRGVRP